MNEIVNKFLLAGDKFMPEMHLRQFAALGKAGFTYSTCGLFTKNKERVKRFMQTGDTWYIYQNTLDEVSFQHDMAYGSYRDLVKRAEFDKVLRDKAYKVARDQ